MTDPGDRVSQVGGGLVPKSGMDPFPVSKSDQERLLGLHVLRYA